MNLYIFQTIISLLVSSSVIYTNTIVYDWASYDGIMYTKNVLCMYMIFDTIVGFNHYIKKDIATLLHHFLFILALYILSININSDSYNNDIYRISRWVLLNELSTIVNNIRILLRSTKYEYTGNVIFGLTFITSRTVAVIGSYYELINNVYFIYTMPICVSICLLNVFWGNMIIRKANNQSLVNTSIKKWNRYTRLSVFILPISSIDLYNHNHTYLSALTSLLVITSILYHYGFKKIRKFDILIAIMVIICYSLLITSVKSFLIYFISILFIILFYINGYKYTLGHCMSHISFVLLSILFLRVNNFKEI